MSRRSLEEFVAAKKHMDVLGSQMAYYEVGEGAPIGHVAIPAAGRAVVRRARRVKPPTTR
ncbi:hypothetical protein HEP87_54795 [Streptomyces sp. S1D4-11]|nr:hypothetical protein [Streptomyces sp. S1D4-11]QIZ01085.1 hypothetical protein HEP87_54795 [Streptomyces sp. S1D4-11]